MNKNNIGLAVDIDDTLSLTTLYWISEMSRLFGNKSGKTAEEILALYHAGHYDLSWTDKDAHAWKDHARHSNEVQEKLELIEKADEYITKISEIIPIAAYITSRPESVRVGTVNWLKKNKFPDAELIMRPISIPYHQANTWKAEKLVQLYPRINALIDDHPVTIERLPQDYQGTIFLYMHHKAPNTTIDVVPCPTWEDVYSAVKERFIG